MNEEQQENKVVAPDQLNPKKWTASLYSSVNPLPDRFVQGVKRIEEELKAPVWILVQNSEEDFDIGAISRHLYKLFFDAREAIPEKQPIALLIDSGGGSPEIAYKLARFLRRRCGIFYALIPNYAKSAATLLSLGADRIILGKHAELGPIDMQVPDLEEESRVSALNHVQTLERLSAFALKTLDESVYLMQLRTRKKINTILPHAMTFTASVVRPLLENIDVVRYTEMSRIMKIAEDYAKRLLADKYGDEVGTNIAAKLVGNYPEHGFVIDLEECRDIGLQVETPEGALSDAYTELLPFLDTLTVHGQLKECPK